VADPEEYRKRLLAGIENYEEFKLFFNAVGLWINQEIDIENNRWAKAELVGATKAPVKKAAFSNPLLEIRYGARRTCFVSFNRMSSTVEAEIEDTEPCERPGKRETRFRLENQPAGAKAFVIDSENGSTAENEMGPRDVAKTVVAGAVRGYFA